MSEAKEKPALGEHIDIPKVSSISGRVAVHNDSGRTLWGVPSQLIVFVMAAALFILPVVLLFLLLRQPDTATHGLTWLWIAMLFITGPIAYMVASGMVRSILEANS